MSVAAAEMPHAAQPASTERHHVVCAASAEGPGKHRAVIAAPDLQTLYYACRTC